MCYLICREYSLMTNGLAALAGQHGKQRWCSLWIRFMKPTHTILLMNTTAPPKAISTGRLNNDLY